MICVGSTAAEGARRSKGQAGKGRSRRAKALMSPVEGLEGGSGRGGACGSVEGCKASVNARCPLPTLSSLTHHLHSPTCTCPHSLASPAHCPLSTGDCPLPSAHWPLPSRSQAGRGRGRVPSLLPSPGLHPARCSPLLPSCSRAPHAAVLALATLALSSLRLGPLAVSSLAPLLLEPRAGRDTFWPLHKGRERDCPAACAPGTSDAFPIDMSTCRHVVPGRPSGALQDLRRRPTGEGDGTRTPTRQHVPFGVLLQMGSWAETAPASAGTWRLAHWLTGGHGAQGHARCSWGAGNDEGQWG